MPANRTLLSRSSSILSYADAATGPNRIETRFEYDDLNRLYKQADAFGSAVAREMGYRYDANGNTII